MWQFTIIDYTQNSTNPQSTIIQEPVGWDAVNLHLKRDDTGHGFFGFEDDTFSSLQYDGNGAAILRAAYYTYGIQAQVQLAVTYNCDGEDPDNNLYLGTFDFTTFKDYVADRCYVECATLVSEAYYLFKNRKDQQVDLDSLASFDQLPVQQTVTCNAAFASGTNQIRVSQLLNGLMAGSKIVILGSSQPQQVFTVASAKPDYSNVNPDGAALAQPPNVSATFDPNNHTISFSQLLSITPNTTLTIDAGLNFTPDGSHYYNNSGTYQVLSVQQFFNYTRITVSVLTLSGTGITNTGMVAQSIDNCILTGTITYTSQPTHTIITVAEGLNDEPTATVTINGQWLLNNMQPYSALSKIITVPAKVIQATSIWKQVLPQEYPLVNSSAQAWSAAAAIWLAPAFINVQSDIDETSVASGVVDYDPDASSPIEQIAYYRQGSLACSGTASVTVNLSGTITGTNGFNPLTDMANTWYPRNTGTIGIRVQTGPGWDGTMATTSPDQGQTIIQDEITIQANGTFTYNKTVPSFIIEPGNYIWFYFGMDPPNFGGSFQSQNPVLLINATDTGGQPSQCIVTINSQCEDTPCSVYLVNEALSRCVESYTNGDIQVYSDYFGRTNAQPVASPANGCGALAAITSGLRIRGCVMPDGSAIPKFCTSINDMFTALDAIHNIGMGMEADPHRPGMLRLRIEPFEYWFAGTLIPLPDVPDVNAPVLEGVMNYTREVQTQLLCSTFKCGYQQFETWNNNGLYDIFGDRKYRTPLNHLENEIDKTCKWMASDYAIEFTRRQFGLTSSDSRYDDATFILCLTQGNTQPVTFWAANGMILGVNAELGVIAGGNSYTVTISGSQNNDGSYNIFWCDTSAGADYAYFIFDGGTTVAESASNISINFYLAGNSHAVVSFQNAYAVFIDATHGAIQLKPPGSATELDSLSVGDTLQLTGSAFPWMNTQIVVGQLFYPSPAYGDVLPTPTPVNTDFPMIIIPHDATLFAQLVPTYYPVSFQDSTSALYLVEQGMQNGTNILSPQTVMNYRISPAHAAMRHYRNIITDRQYANEHLIFTGGTGNFYALGTLTDSCAPEGDNLSEGSYLSLTNFAVPDDGKPLFYPEIVKFEYPLTWAQFLAIQANPYGLIRYEHANDGVQQGWITDLQYHPYTGLAEFTLYPKI